MSKKVFRNLVFIGIVLAVVSFCFYDIASVLAADNNSVEGGLETVAGGAGLANADLKSLIGKIIKVILGFLGIVAVCLVLYGGFLYMTSGGEQEKVADAKKYITNALIGLVIILLSYSIVAFVMSRITGALTDATYTYQCADGIDNDGDGSVDFPSDKGCYSATYYSEKSGFDISGYGLLKTDQFSPPPAPQKIINVHPRISFNQAVSEATVNLSNLQITTSAGTVSHTIVDKPKTVTEPNGHGEEILTAIKEMDHNYTADWVMCDEAHLGGTPMLIEFDVSDNGTETAANSYLDFQTTESGADSLVNISCGKSEDNLILMKEKWLPPDGKNSLNLDPACLGGDKVFIKWARQGTTCLKMNYVRLRFISDFPGVDTVNGTFKFWNGGRLVEFVPAGVCDPLNPGAYALKKDTEYTVSLKNKASATDKIGLKAANGDELFCETTHPCTFKFTTGDICDVTPPTVNFDAFNKNVCQFPSGAEDDRMIPFTAEDDVAVSVVSLYVDPKGDATDQAISSVTQTDELSPEIFSSSIPWAVNDYPLGSKNFEEHSLMLQADDIDGNHGTKKMDVIVRPDFCCDATGVMLACTDPAYNPVCGACDDGVCRVDGDCNGGYCADGVCVFVPVINNVNPKEGGDGNFITIYGSGFSDYTAGVSGVFFTGAAGTMTLPAEVPCDPADAWKDNQIIVKVPAGIEDGPIKVVTNSLDSVTKTYQFDDTTNDLGWIGDFSKNLNLQYPGLCSMTPEEGSPGAYTVLGGEKFGSRGTSDNIYFGDFSAAVMGAWSDTSITNVRVPQINKGLYNVVVGKGERCQKTKADCVAGSGSCLEDCVKDSIGCNCYNVMSNPLSFNLIESSSFPTITEITPRICTATAATTCDKEDEGTNGCTCMENEPVKTCTLSAKATCIEGSSEDCVCTGDAFRICLKLAGSKCLEGESNCSCKTAEPVKICTKHEICTKGTDACICSGAGPLNQIISVLGTNFGDKTGQVIFSPLQSDGHGGFMEARNPTTEELEPSFIGLLACGAASWSDTEVKVKVPETLPGSTTAMTPGNYWVKIITNQSLPSNNKNFIVNTNAPGPGICSISPNNGPMNTVVTIVGENFGTDKSIYNVSFDKKDVDTADLRALVDKTDLTWVDKQIGNAKVPADAMTGGVLVHSADRSVESNSVQFKLGICTDTSCLASQFCCGDGVCKDATAGQTKQDVCVTTVQSHNSEYAWVMSTGVIPKIPAVLERTCLVPATGTGYTQSPSPAKSDELACPNGLISATFNMTLNLTALDGKITLRKCRDEECNLATYTASEWDSITFSEINPLDIWPQPESADSTNMLTSFSLYDTLKVYPGIGSFLQQGIDATLKTDTWYQVEILGGTSGVASPSGKAMTENYSWFFKTKAANCEPDKFLMTPSKGIIKSVQQIQKYLVSGMSGCQQINVEDKPWVWTVPATEERAEKIGYGCKTGPALYCTVDPKRNDIGVYAINDSKLENCKKADDSACVNQFEEGCECRVDGDLETSTPIIISADAVVAKATVVYHKTGELEINFSEPRVTSFYPNCKEACINAQLGVTFNTKMKTPVKENIKIYTCETEECTVVTPSTAEIDTVTYIYNPAIAPSTGDNILKIDLKPNTNLLFNKYHRVVISNALESISGVHLTGLNYHDAGGATGLNSFSWVFKTKNDQNQCVIDSVNVVPANYEAATPGEVVSYSVEPTSAPDKCNITGQILNPLHYPWTWSTKDSDNDVTGDNTDDTVFPNSYFPTSNVNDGAPLAEITNKVYNAAASGDNKCTGNCLLKGSITYRAVCGDGKIGVGEECDFSQAEETAGKTMVLNEAGVEVIDEGVACNDTSCLLNNFSPCTVAELISEDSVCCGNGRVNGQEECDFAAEYKDKNGVSCDPAAATQANPPCALVSKSKACTPGCLNAGTAVGYVCGNGIKEAGEDSDDSNNKPGDGISNTCLKEGSQIKYTAGLSICGNHVVDPGEKCDPLVSDPATNKALCNDKCLVTGYPLCVNPTDTLCCGNGNLTETIPGLGLKACDKTACFKEEACPVQTANMVQCAGILPVAGCSLMGAAQNCFCGEDLILSDKVKCTGVLAIPGCTVQSGKCVCAEANTCGANGKIKVSCDRGTDNCVCDFSEGCTTKCTNLGSDIKYGSQCGNGTKEEGEDAACEVASAITCTVNTTSGKCMCGTVESDMSKCNTGSPYQKATINTEKHSATSSVFQVVLRLNPDVAPKTSYSLTKKIIAATVEKIEGETTPKSGDTGITLRVPKSVYNEAVNTTCEAGTALNPTTIPANNAQDVCRNIALVISTPLTEVKGEDICVCAGVTQATMELCNQPIPGSNCRKENNSLFFYYRAATCVRGEISNPAPGYLTQNTTINWFVNGYEKAKEFVRSLLFKVGLADPLKFCVGPEMTMELKQTTSGIEMRAIPKELLLPDTRYGIVLKNLKNKCNRTITPNPAIIEFTTGAEACRLDNVVVSPADLFVMKSGQSFAYTAYAKSGINEIFPMPGVYNWDWNWESTDTALAQIVNPSGTAADVVTQTKNGQGQIKATATISEDALGQVCTNGSGASCTYGTANCYCSYSPGEESTTGATYTGVGNIKVFICDNPWFGDVYNSFNRSIPPEYQYNSGEAITHKKLDLKLELTNNGQLMPSYLVEKEFNAGLFYCRDFGKDKDLSDDLPLVGLMTGAFTEVNPNPRFGIYFDRNYDYVEAHEDLNPIMNDYTKGWTISTWVYNDDLPQDRYVRIFYKNLTTSADPDGLKSVPNQAHVQLGVRSWCSADPACWSDVMSGLKTREQCGACTVANIKRSVVFEIKYPGKTAIYKGVEAADGLLNNGFNQILLSHRSGIAALFINGKMQCDLAAASCTGAKTLENQTAPMFVWPRQDTCIKSDGSSCAKNDPGCVCISEKDEAGADYDKLFIGGLGKTKVPLVSFGGYMDDFRVWAGAKTPEQINTNPETGLKAAWDFNSTVPGTVNCTADYSASCTLASGEACTTPSTDCICSISSQCIQDHGGVPLRFKYINITDVAKSKGIFYGDNSGWQELNVDTQNQCNNGIDDDNNGLIDSHDPKCTSATDGWEEPALFAQYFFVRKTDNDYATTNDNAPDAISLRIYENPEGLPPSLWYARNVPNPASSVPIINSDCLTDSFGEFCYAGVQDGRTLYVSASNINGSNVWNNIYLLSYSQGANPATQNIFGQLVQFLKFNMNELDSGTISKIKLIRDTQRLQDFVLMQEYVNVYKSQHGGKVPQLEAGTLQRHNTNSVWDSWKTTFKTELGLDMPIDPINALYNVPPTYKYTTATGVACKKDDAGCISSTTQTVDCGADSSGNILACSSTQQCILPGVACIDCSSSGGYDSKACYNSSTLTFANLYSYYNKSKTATDNIKNFTYTYEANGADATQSQFRIRYFYEIPTLNYRYVPVVESSGTGWDQLQVAPPEVVVAPTAPKACSDGVDNDVNGKTDYPNDPGCTGPDDPAEDYLSMCKDNTDNDSDGTCDVDGCCSNATIDTQADCDARDWKPADPSCTSAFDNDEFWPPQCSDGVDNDGDNTCDFAGCCSKPVHTTQAACISASATWTPPEILGCTEANDDSEGNILFAFFVDSSISMSGGNKKNDPEYIHKIMIKTIIDGVHETGTNIKGLHEVFGNKAYYVLSNSRDDVGLQSEKFLTPSNDAAKFLKWLTCKPGWLACVNAGTNGCDATYACGDEKKCPFQACTTDNECASNECSTGNMCVASDEDICSSPYAYMAASNMPGHINEYLNDVVTLYETSSYNFKALVYFIITDAEDGYFRSENLAYQKIVTSTTTANTYEMPIHFIYVRKDGELTAEPDLSKCAAEAAGDDQCLYELYSMYSNKVNSKHRGIWLQGTVDSIKPKLESLMSVIAALPPLTQDVTLEENY